MSLDPIPSTIPDTLKSSLDANPEIDENRFSYELIASNPSLHTRIRSIVQTIDIRKSRRLELGYSERPSINVGLFLDLVGDTALLHDDSYDAKDKKRALGKTILESCISVRDDIEKVLGTDDTSNQPTSELFASLPWVLQLIALLKSFDGESGSVARPGQLQTNSNERKKVINYLTRSGIDKQEAEALIDTVCIIHAPLVIEGYLIGRTHHQDGSQLEIYTRDRNKYLKGPIVPESGIYLPENIEVAALKTYALSYYIDNLHWIRSETEEGTPSEETQTRFNEIRGALDAAFEISGKPQDERTLWTSYLATKAIIQKAFRGNHQEGYSAGIDQLTAWIEPVPDEEYQKKFKGVLDAIEDWGALEDSDRSGFQLALHSFSIGLIDSIERSIIIGDTTSRAGRLRVLATICDLLDTSLEQDILSRTPMLARQIEITRNPWDARYKT